MLSFSWSISNSMYRLLQKRHFDSLCSLGHRTGLGNGNGNVFYIYAMQKAGAFKTRALSVRRFNILTRVPFYKQYLCHGIDSIFIKWPSTQHSAGLSRAWPPGFTCTVGCTRHQNGPLNILCSLPLCLSCSALPYASVALLWLPLISLRPSLCVNKKDSVFNLNLCTSFPLFRTPLLPSLRMPFMCS